MAGNYLKRYEAGEFGVWGEIMSSAAAVVASPALLAEASDVASAIMKRVNINYLTLRNTLTKAGLALAPEGKPLTDADLSLFTNRFGPLPLTLDVFYKSIGSLTIAPVDYDYGSNELEEMDGIDILTLDPLVIEPANVFDFLLDEYDANFTEDEEEENPFGLYLCADYLHKADVSGGEPHTVYIPATDPENKIDPIVDSDDGALPLVEYLRHYFKWGGFPGLAVMDEPDDDEVDLNRQMPFENVKGDWRVAARRLLERLRPGLIAF